VRAFHARVKHIADAEGISVSKLIEEALWLRVDKRRR
jgi:predicted HicB family RNase H-like nuclease